MCINVAGDEYVVLYSTDLPWSCLLFAYLRENSGIAKEFKSAENDGKRCHPPLVIVIGNPQWNY